MNQLLLAREARRKNEKGICNILNHYEVGQFAQMYNQIKAYGVKRFFMDLYEYLIVDEWINDGYKTYSELSNKFHWMTPEEAKNE